MFKPQSFSKQFLLFSLVILLGGMMAIGLWMQAEIERAVVNRTAGVTALFVDSFVSPHLQELESGDELSAESREALERLLSGTPLGVEIVSFKVWNRDGTVIFSPNPAIVGQTFDPHGELDRVFGGEVISGLTDLTEAENAYEAQRWDRLIETYAPIRLAGSGETIAVSEFYQVPDALESDIRSAQLRGWAMIAGATAIMYLFLVGIVRRASNLIAAQHTELVENVERITAALYQNRDLQERVQGAAVRTTALNERYLRRISADLHDGPAQNVALALLRMDSIAQGVKAASNGETVGNAVSDIDTVRKALNGAIEDLRAIARGLRLPEISGLSPEETVEKVIGEFRQLTGSVVELTVIDIPATAPLPIKITLYRVLQEALANSFKHAYAETITVRLTGQGTEVSLKVSDDGGGFDTTERETDDTLGLVGMRERIQLLGGTFQVSSAIGAGTTISISLPLAMAVSTDV